MAFTLQILNTAAEQIVQATGLTPFTFFLGTITIAIGLFLLDLNKGVSLDIPGRGQIGLSASFFIFGALIMILAAEGYQFFFTEIAKTALSLILVAPFVAWMLSRK